MTEKTGLHPTDHPRVIETIPSHHGGISALASANAPFVVFDIAPFAGYHDGLGEITLVARRRMGSTVDNTVATDFSVTAHLRGSLQAMRELRRVIDDLLLLAQPTPGEGSAAN